MTIPIPKPVPGAIPARGGRIDLQRERATVTRAALIAAARTVFAEEGFHEARTTHIVARAGVTRGALYHHFRDKDDLFEAVFLETTADLDRHGRQAVADWPGDLWSKVQAALASHLRLLASNRAYQRILLIDGPAVLGWSRWREIQSRFSAQDTANALAQLADQGVLASDPPARLPHLIQAALNDSALSIAHAEDPGERSEEELAALVYLLEGLRR